MQFVVTAYDGTDKDAPARRQKARSAHLDGVQKLKEKGKIIAGGAILNDKGDMIGSTVYVDFDSKEELNAWINNDPYVKEGVWQKIEILPIRLAVKP